MADFNYSVGLSYGYSIPLAHRLSLDMGLSLGYIGGSYIKYNYADGCYIWQSDMRRRYVGLTRAEVALVWNIEGLAALHQAEQPLDALGAAAYRRRAAR